MTRNAFTVSAFILVFSTFSASAQTLISQGDQTCDKWAAAHSASADASALDNWVIGYLQGKANYIESDDRTRGMTARNILRGLDGPTIVRLTGEYCGSKPLQTVARAADQLAAQATSDISARTGEAAPTQVEVTTDKPPVETTGSGDITGSISSGHSCREMTIKDASNDPIRRFRKCD